MDCTEFLWRHVYAPHLFNVRPLLGIGGQHVSHQRPQVLGIFVRNCWEFSLYDLTGQSVQAAEAVVPAASGVEPEKRITTKTQGNQSIFSNCSSGNQRPKMKATNSNCHQYIDIYTLGIYRYNIYSVYTYIYIQHLATKDNKQYAFGMYQVLVRERRAT